MWNWNWKDTIITRTKFLQLNVMHDGISIFKGSEVCNMVLHYHFSGVQQLTKILYPLPHHFTGHTIKHHRRDREKEFIMRAVFQGCMITHLIELIPGEWGVESYVVRLSPHQHTFNKVKSSLPIWGT